MGGLKLYKTEYKLVRLESFLDVSSVLLHIEIHLNKINSAQNWSKNMLGKFISQKLNDFISLKD